MEFRIYTLTKDDNDRRIDRVARRFLPKLSLAGIYKLLRKGLIRLDGKKAHPDQKVFEGSKLGIAPTLLDSMKDVPDASPLTRNFVPEVLLETGDLLFINKPSGIPVHGTGGLDQLIPQTQDAEASLSFRTGPLHRLDQDTTGILSFSRSLDGARWFSNGVCDRQFEKYYLGIIDGTLQSPAEWQDLSEDHKAMITHAQPLAFSKEPLFPLTLVRFRIITGRKHQIRIQSALHGHPLTGDTRYGAKPQKETYFLHAWQMVFPENRLSGLPCRLTAPLPERFKSLLVKTFADDVLAHIEQGELYWN